MAGFDNIFGNKENIKMFSSLIAQGKLSHAYMLYGARGSGKKTMALAIAEALAKDASDEMRSRILTERCPDVSIIRRPDDKKTMGVSVVRDLISTVSLSPSDLDFKMYIIDNADTMTTQAQNALLKVIEEPPKNTYIILLCENPSSMLQTVRSRVQAVGMECFKYDVLSEYLKKHEGTDVTAERFMFAAKMSEGAIGKTAEILKNDEMYNMYLSVCEILRMQTRKFTEIRYFQFISYISDICKSRDSIALMLDLLYMAYRDILIFKYSDRADAVFLTNEKAMELSERFACESLELVQKSISDIRAAIEFNVNTSITASMIAAELWNVV